MTEIREQVKNYIPSTEGVQVPSFEVTPVNPQENKDFSPKVVDTQAKQIAEVQGQQPSITYQTEQPSVVSSSKVLNKTFDATKGSEWKSAFDRKVPGAEIVE